jgi:hypothetical protein
MQNKDSFDEPGSAGIFAGIVRVLDARHAFAARGPLWAGGLVVATVAVLGAVIFYAYPREAAEQELAAAPIIRADAGELKVAPDDPGGMEIAHRESVVFDTLNGGEGRVENLLPQAEAPLPREEMFAGLKTEAEDEIMDVTATPSEGTPTPADPQSFDEVADYTPPAEGEVAAVSTETAAPVGEVVEEVTTAAVQEDVPAVTAAVDATKEVAKEVAKTEPAAGIATVAKETAKAGTHFVQLASVKDEAAAKAEWKKMQAAHGVLAPLNLNLERADLGAKGVFFRIQGGPVSEAEAKQICQAISAKKPGGCLVVKD